MDDTHRFIKVFLDEKVLEDYTCICFDS